MLPLGPVFLLQVWCRLLPPLLVSHFTRERFRPGGQILSDSLCDCGEFLEAIFPQDEIIRVADDMPKTLQLAQIHKRRSRNECRSQLGQAQGHALEKLLVKIAPPFEMILEPLTYAVEDFFEHIIMSIEFESGRLERALPTLRHPLTSLLGSIAHYA